MEKIQIRSLPISRSQQSPSTSRLSHTLTNSSHKLEENSPSKLYLPPSIALSQTRLSLLSSPSTNLSIASQQSLYQQTHENDKRKKGRILTKCHGGDERREEVGHPIQVFEFGTLGFRLRFSPPIFSVVLFKIASSFTDFSSFYLCSVN